MAFVLRVGVVDAIAAWADKTMPNEAERASSDIVRFKSFRPLYLCITQTNQATGISDQCQQIWW